VVLVNDSNGNIIADSLEEANTFWKRFKGLMFTEKLAKGKALFFKPCKSIHTFFMKYPIDVIYLRKDLTIIAVDEGIAPFKIGKLNFGVDAVIEMPAGTLKQTQTQIGHKLTIINN